MFPYVVSNENENQSYLLIDGLKRGDLYGFIVYFMILLTNLL